MTDDIADLKARVEAARERLDNDAALAQKVELRLNDLVSIVEGSLSRQSAQLEKAETRVTELETDLGRALARADQAQGEAQRAERLAKENGELRQMVMTLLEVIEGRQKSSLGAVMQKLEHNVSALIEPEAAEVAAEPVPEAPALTIEPEEVAEASSDLTQIQVEDDVMSGEADADSPIEDIGAVANYEAAEEVIEPGKDDPSLAPPPQPSP